MEIIATKREIFGKKNKSLRRQKQIPAIMYGKGIESLPLTINSLRFINVYRESGETALVDLKIDDKIEKVLVDEVQLHPVTLQPVHVNFHKVNLKEKIKANIPVEVIGEEECAIIKSGEGLVLTLLNEIIVEALPTDLPSNFEVDISKFSEVGQGFTVAELEYDKDKVKIIDLDEDTVIVKIDSAQMAEEVEEEVKSEEELIGSIEVTKEKSDEEETADGTEKEAEEK